ncbi:MAG: hypothetical protein V1743_00940 [Nanoarchaeota archaeon]
MVIIELKKTFEKRRQSLITVLSSPDSGIDLGVQHQIYGAIKEIEIFLRTLEHLQEREQQDGMDIALRNDQAPGIMEKVMDKLKPKQELVSGAEQAEQQPQ